MDGNEWKDFLERMEHVGMRGWWTLSSEISCRNGSSQCNCRTGPFQPASRARIE